MVTLNGGATMVSGALPSDCVNVLRTLHYTELELRWTT